MCVMISDTATGDNGKREPDKSEEQSVNGADDLRDKPAKPIRVKRVGAEGCGYIISGGGYYVPPRKG